MDGHTNTDTKPPRSGVILDPIVYGSGRVAAECGDLVEVREMDTTWLVMRDGSLIYTTQDKNWMLQHVIMDGL